MTEAAVASPRRSFRAAAVAIGLLGAVVAAAETRAADAPTASLTVTFIGIKTPVGTVMVALDGDEDAYAGKGRAAAQAAIACKGATVTAAFTGLTPGTYAVRAFHDLNGDGKLNTNPFGIPTEPYAFSRDARGAAAPPDWSAAAFEIKAGDNAQTIAID